MHWEYYCMQFWYWRWEEDKTCSFWTCRKVGLQMMNHGQAAENKALHISRSFGPSTTTLHQKNTFTTQDGMPASQQPISDLPVGWGSVTESGSCLISSFIRSWLLLLISCPYLPQQIHTPSLQTMATWKDLWSNVLSKEKEGSSQVSYGYKQVYHLLYFCIKSLSFNGTSVL